jgi:8-oxo-dGTP pyrophosphatase MutT (NUDIX family)
VPISPYLRGLREAIGHALLVMPSVTGVVFDARRRVLLLRHHDSGVWVVPGGSVDPHELPADAVVRELWEEAGVVVEPARLIGVYGGPDFEVRYANGDRVSYLMTVFECRLLRGTPVADGAETLEHGWFGEGDLAELEVAPWVPRVLADAFSGALPAAFQAPTTTCPLDGGG